MNNQKQFTGITDEYQTEIIYHPTKETIPRRKVNHRNIEQHQRNTDTDENINDNALKESNTKTVTRSRIYILVLIFNKIRSNNQKE